MVNSGSSFLKTLNGPKGLDFAACGRLLQHCTDHRLLRQGKQIHCRLVLSSVVLGNFLASKLVTFYSKTSPISDARKVFDETPNRNTLTWNAMLSGYSSRNMHAETLEFFSLWLRSQTESARPDNFTVTSILKTLSASLPDLKLAAMFHSFVIQNGFDSDIFVMNPLITYYSRCGDVASARSLFDSMSERDLATWNSMFAGYSQGGYHEDCKRLYKEMLSLKGLRPNGVTLVSVLQACTQSSDLVLGMDVHRFIVANHIKMDLSLCNSIIALYAKCGSFDYAMELLESMPEKDGVTYGAIISGYMVHGFVDQALKLFREMECPGLSTWNAVISGLMQNNRHGQVVELFREFQSASLKPNAVTLSSILPSLAHFSNLKGAKLVHAYAVRNDMYSNVHVTTALIDTYSKLGFNQAAHNVFDQSPYRTVVLWTTLISTYVANGNAKMALDLFNEMLSRGTQPDSVTFMVILKACAHSGAVDEARQKFDMMLVKYRIQPSVEHYACMVGVLSRAGELSEAVRFISEMPIKPSAKVWGALLSGASLFGDVEIGRFACEHLFDIEPENTGNYVILENLFLQAQRWEEAKSVREKMNYLGLNKIAGSSIIQ